MHTEHEPVGYDSRIRKNIKNSHLCLVDFATAEEAKEAIRNMNGRDTEYGSLRVEKTKAWGTLKNLKGRALENTHRLIRLGPWRDRKLHGDKIVAAHE